MSILCKFNAGKRLNLASRGSFQCRSIMSGLRYNEGIEWQKSEWKNILNVSPGKNFTKFMEDNSRALNLKSKRKSTLDHMPGTTKKPKISEKNLDYGPHAVQPTLTEEEYESEKTRILKTLKVGHFLITKML